MSVRRHLTTAACVLGLVSAGLVTGATASAHPKASGDLQQSVEVLVKSDHTVVMRQHLRAGVTTFHVASQRPAGFQIVEPEDGYTKRSLSRDAFRAFEREDVGALRRLEAGTTFFGGVFTLPDEPATMSVILEEGTYWVLDTDPTRPRPADILTVHVFEHGFDGHDGDGHQLDGDHDPELSGQVIRAVDGEKWGKVTPRITRKGTILFENRSTDNHFLQIMKLKTGKTMRDFRVWIRNVTRGVEGPPPVNERIATGTGVLSPGESMSFDYRLPAGRYVMFCFWPDADEGGTPHVFMGMYRGLRVG